MDPQLEAIVANFASLQNLDDDMVKLVAYNIVCLEYGSERLLDEGSGTVLITERMTANDFIAFIIDDYLNGDPQRDPKLLAQVEPGSLDVHFNVVRRWPRRDPRFDENRIRALSGVRDALLPHEREEKGGGS